MRKEQTQRQQLDEIISGYEVNVIGLDPEFRNAESVKEEN